MSRKNKIIISISGIVIVLLLLLGLTYGFYLTRINGNSSDKSVTVSLANLELTYSDGNGLVESNNMIPGESITKTFTVENTGNKKVINYLIYLEDVVNTFEDKNDLKVTLTCTSNSGTCNGNTLTYPSSNTVIGVNDIEVKEKQEFSLKVEFLETNDNQDDNQNKKFSGNVKLKDMKSTSSEIVSNEGENILEINNAKAINHLLVYGNSTQEVRSGKNLAKISGYNRSSTTTLISDTNGIYRVKGNDGSNSNSWSSGNINILFDNISTANKTITVSFYAIRYNDGVWKSSSDSVTQIRIEGADSSNASSYNLTNYDNYPIGEKTLLKATFTPTFDVEKIIFFLNGMEWQIDTNTVQIEEGSVATDYEPYGATPSPDIPSEINSVGDLVTDTSDSNYGKYKIPVTASSKNLIYSNRSTGTDLTLNTSNTEAILNGNSTSNIGIYYNKDQAITLEPGTYTFSYYYDSGKINSSPDKFWIGIRGDTGSWLATVGVSSNYQSTLSKSFTITENTSVSFSIVGNGNVDNLKFKYQLESGSTATDYVPYKKETTNIYLDEPLRKIGDKSDYIDLKNGKIVRNVAYKMLNGTESWQKFESTNVYQLYTSSLNLNGIKSSSAMSNLFPYGVTTDNRLENGIGSFLVTNGSDFGVQLYGWQHLSIDDWKNWLTNDTLYFEYQLVIQNDETVSLPSILTDESTKTIEIKTSTKPSKTKIDYVK